MMTNTNWRSHSRIFEYIEMKCVATQYLTLVDRELFRCKVLPEDALCSCSGCCSLGLKQFWHFVWLK